MHVVIDAVTAAEKDNDSGPTGIGLYARQMIRWLPRVSGADTRFTVCVPAWMSETSPARWGIDADRVQFTRTPLGDVPFLSRHVLLPAVSALRGGDVWFSPHGQIPWGWRKPAVITVHDLSILDHPEWFPEGEDDSVSTQVSVPASIERADRIVAVSEFTKDQISRHFPGSTIRTSVVHEGVEIPGDVSVKDTGSDGEDVILFVGTLEPRKNLVNALEAFDAFLQSHPGSAQETRFVIAGKKGWRYEDIEHKIDEVNAAWRDVGEDVVRYLGYVSDQEKWSLLNRAEVLFYPSLEEGFGLPVLEAMRIGTSVVTSRRGAIPEVAGDTAFYVEPENTEQMALTLAQCLLLPEGVSGMTDQAQKRAKQFTWEATAKETLRILESASS